MSVKQKLDRVLQGQRIDGWKNLLTGVGTLQYDKRFGAEFVRSTSIDDEQADDLWANDDLAARIIELWPNEMLREGFTFRMQDEDMDPDASAELQDFVHQRWQELDLQGQTWMAAAWERAKGGGALLLGAVDNAGSLAEPLNEEAVREFNYITALEPRELQVAAFYDDPKAPKFGQPALYSLHPLTMGLSVNPTPPQQGELIHETRLVVFRGIVPSRRRRNAQRTGWGESVLTRVYGVLRDYHGAWDSAGILLTDFAQSVLKIKGLADALAMDSDDLIKNRAAAVELSRSVARAVLIDSEEEFERKQTPLNQMPEMLDRFGNRLAAAADIPVTLLMGTSPGGLNATGESDIRFFYDRVKAKQQIKIVPAYERISRLILRAAGMAVPESFSVTPNPLWQPTEKEVAEARETQAKTDQIYINTGVLMPFEVTTSRFGGDEYSFETQFDQKERERLEALEPDLVPEDDDSEPVDGADPTEN